MSNIKEFFAKRKQEKLDKMRKKNWELRQEGKDPHKGWGSMVDTGLGGLNNSNRDHNGPSFRTKEIDNKAFCIEESKNKRKE